MNMKEKLEELKNKLQVCSVKNRDYEFEAELENHQPGDQEIYRLYFIDYHRIGEGYRNDNTNNVGVIDWPFEPFMLPEGMSREDSFKVLSYLTDFIEKDSNLEACSYKSVEALNRVLDLERLGFKKVNIKLEDNSDDVIDLFTIRGRILLFKQSKYYKKYFEWYTEGITLEEIKKIYKKCNIDFYDLVPTVSNYQNNFNAPKLVKIK